MSDNLKAGLIVSGIMAGGYAAGRAIEVGCRKVYAVVKKKMEDKTEVKTEETPEEK